MTVKAKVRLEGEDATGAAFRSALGNANNAASNMQRMFKAAFAGISVAAIAGVAKQSIEFGDNIAKAAAKAGLGAKAMSELAHVAKMSDIELSSLSTSLKKMQVNLSEAASGGKSQTETLRALGLTISDIKNLKADQQFELIAQKISELRSEEDRARAATEVFGKAGADLLPAFEDGARGIRIAREEAVEMSKSLSEEQVAALSSAENAVKKLGEQWDAFMLSMTAHVAPKLTEALEAINATMTGGKTLDRYQLKVATENLARAKAAGADAESIARIEARIATLRKSVGDSGAAVAAASLPGALPAAPRAPGYRNTAAAESAAKTADKSRKEMDALLEAQRRYFEEGEQLTMTQGEADKELFDRRMAYLDVELQTGNMALDVYEARAQAARDAWSEGLEEVQTRNTELVEIVERGIIEMPGLAQIAADNTYGAFEDFFFDPVHVGIKGLAQDLLTSLRHSIAQTFADKAVKGLGDALTDGALKGVGSLMGFADGGNFDGRAPFIVGERGPEIVVPRGAGSVIPNHKLGGAITFNINNNIDARGATMELAKTLPGILTKHSEATELRIVQRLRRGYYGL